MARKRTYNYIPSTRIANLPLIYPWGDPYEGWAHNWIKKHFWKVRRVYFTPEDALQECALIFVNISRRYGKRVDNGAWLMALYQRAVMNAWTTAANADTRRELEVLEENELSKQVEALEHSNSYYEQPNASLSVAMSEASTELKQVLAMLINAPSEFLEVLFASEDDASINRRCKRLLGIHNPNLNVIKELREILT